MALLTSLAPGRNFNGLMLAVFALVPLAAGQKKIACPDGEHIEIDVRQLSIRYDASSFPVRLAA